MENIKQLTVAESSLSQSTDCPSPISVIDLALLTVEIPIIISSLISRMTKAHPIPPFVLPPWMPQQCGNWCHSAKLSPQYLQLSPSLGARSNPTNHWTIQRCHASPQNTMLVDSSGPSMILIQCKSGQSRCVTAQIRFIWFQAQEHTGRRFTTSEGGGNGIYQPNYS